MKRIFLLGLLNLVGVLSFGQTDNSAVSQKIGYVNIEYITSKWLSFVNAKTELGTYENQQRQRIENETRDLEEYYVNAQKLKSQDSLQRAEQVLRHKQEDIQLMQQQATKNLEKKYVEKIQPLLDILFKKIEEVGMENGYSYVLNQQNAATQTIVVLFAKNDEDNLSDKVLEKLK